MSKSLLSAALATALAGLAAAPAAVAGTPSGGFAIFKYCPYNNPVVGACVVNTIKSGSFVIGSTTLPVVPPIVLQGGITAIEPSPLFAAIGAPTLSSPPAKVPGGLLGIMNPAPNWPFPLWAAFWSAVNTANDVTATMEPVATIQTNFGNALYPPNDGSDPTAARLPLRVRLQNPFLGNTCYIGSAQSPVTVSLQTGTTAPPPPNKPISGNIGNAYFVQVGDDPYAYIQVDNATLVDNAFSVPAAKGCGNVALGLPIVTQVLDALVSGAVNLKVGLPSAAGKNTAILTGNTSLGSAEYVRNSAQ